MYLTFRVLHFVFLISWMAGILYLWRLLIYHRESSEPLQKNLLSLMAWRLGHYILIPAVIGSWLFGAGMLLTKPYLLKAGWIHGKLFLLILLTGSSHGALSLTRKIHQGLPCRFSGKQLRFLNEIPTLLMIGVVYLAVVKPF